MHGCSKRGARSTFADALHSLAPSAMALRAALLARGVALQAPSGPPGEGAADAESALLPSPVKGVAPPPAAFPAALSCPPEFWGKALAILPFQAERYFIDVPLSEQQHKPCLKGLRPGLCLLVAFHHASAGFWHESTALCLGLSQICAPIPIKVT